MDHAVREPDQGADGETRSTPTTPRSLSFIPLSTSSTDHGGQGEHALDREIDRSHQDDEGLAEPEARAGSSPSWLIRTKFPKLRKLRLMPRRSNTAGREPSSAPRPPRRRSRLPACAVGPRRESQRSRGGGKQMMPGPTLRRRALGRDVSGALRRTRHASTCVQRPDAAALTPAIGRAHDDPRRCALQIARIAQGDADRVASRPRVADAVQLVVLDLSAQRPQMSFQSSFGLRLDVAVVERLGVAEVMMTPLP